ncbi:hypothetical protein ACJMK2_009532 [Sinanodonta woodiana]|uniref:Uncharacterized protein n=1 Tax=Sinanodonta woodiana TaxID=1069815 RepID=A0ABD3VCK6_SINWO
MKVIEFTLLLDPLNPFLGQWESQVDYLQERGFVMPCGGNVDQHSYSYNNSLHAALFSASNFSLLKEETLYYSLKQGQKVCSSRPTHCSFPKIFYHSQKESKFKQQHLPPFTRLVRRKG